jgi:hypothetical protein
VKISFNFNDLILIPKLPAPRELNFLKLVYGIKVKSNFQMVLSKIRQMEKSNQKISTIGIGFGNRPIADNQNSSQYKLGSGLF